jgi:hypothetical protein
MPMQLSTKCDEDFKGVVKMKTWLIDGISAFLGTLG